MANEFIIRNGLRVISGTIEGVLASGIVLSGSIASGAISKFHIASGQVVKSLTQGTNITISADANDNYTINATISGGVAIAPLVVSSGLSFSSGSFFDGTQSGAIIGINSGGITSQLIADNAVVSGKIASGSIGIYQLASGVISTATLGSGQVTSGVIASGSVGQFALSSGAVNSGHIGNAAVVSGSIASGSITGAHIASGAIVNANLTTGLIQSSNMAGSSVLSGAIGSGVIGSVHLADGAILSGDISSGQIGQAHIASGVLFAVTNPTDNRVLTSLASGTNQANAESNFTFDGSNLNVGLISGLSTFAVTSGGYVKIQSSLFSGQAATFDAYQIPQTDGTAAFYDYYVFNSANGSYRAGNVVTTWNTLSGIIVYSETGTDDLGGTTIGLQWSTVLQSGNVVLRSTLTDGTWNVKVGARVL